MDSLLFPIDEYLDPAYLSFLKSDLGKLYRALPLKELAAQFSTGIPKSRNGRKAIFSVEGGLALMFLKHYLKLSDKKLIARINTDYHLQFFCGVRIPFTTPVKDKDMVGRWRRFFGIHMNIDKIQDILAEAWKPYMNQTHVLMDDATCYESYIKYPTDIKLLFDCSQYLFNQIEICCKRVCKKVPRTKYKYQIRRQKTYSKLKRKPKKRRIKRNRELLYWVERGLDILQDIFNAHPELHGKKMRTVYDKVKIIQTIYQQQYMKFHIQGYKIKHRIVSLYKPYLRPIVRGKEGKRVEFGAKVHMSQVDQINFIEHLNFDAFHEGVRMWKSVFNHRKRFKKCSQYSGDKLYANNDNRKFATKRGISTSFVRKGRASKDEEQKSILRIALNKARSTKLEGSFGNEKNHYGLRKVKARTKETEIAWIFFGIHTANAVKISKRLPKTIEVPIEMFQAA